ncbi:MAG: threonine synthase, partial [Eubacteriaceae bacterium]|nr:threonine synthase [Eubacteriaceae bacterium]
MKKSYNSTRSKDITVTASEGILGGLAPDGGLFVPNFIHNNPLDKTKLIGKNYGELAQVIFSAFLTDFSETQIKDAIQSAYYSGNFEFQEP